MLAKHQSVGYEDSGSSAAVRISLFGWLRLTLVLVTSGDTNVMLTVLVDPGKRVESAAIFL
jgi:hypothetical protein